jgi:hypothetical protein
MAGVSGVAAWSRPQCRDIGRLDIFAGDDRRNLHIYAEPQRKQVAYTAMPFCEWDKLHRALLGAPCTGIHRHFDVGKPNISSLTAPSGQGQSLTLKINDR